MKKPIDIVQKSEKASQISSAKSDTRFLGKQVEKLKMQAQFFSFGNLLLTLVVIGLAIGLAWWTFQKLNRSGKELTSQKLSQILPEEQSQPLPTESEKKTQNFNFTPEKKAQETAGTATEPEPEEKPEKPAKDSFRIRVLNGNGITASAKQIKSALQDKGFQVGKVGNAKSFSYEQTKIYYLAQNQAQADLVAEALADRSISKEEAGAELIGEGYQILVVVGKT